MLSFIVMTNNIVIGPFAKMFVIILDIYVSLGITSSRYNVLAGGVLVRREVGVHFSAEALVFIVV